MGRTLQPDLQSQLREKQLNMGKDLGKAFSLSHSSLLSPTQANSSKGLGKTAFLAQISWSDSTIEQKTFCECDSPAGPVRGRPSGVHTRQ